VFENFKGMWQGAGSGARLGLVMGLLVIAVALGVSVSWALKRDHQVLFADLEPQDAASIVAELDRMKLPYTLAEDGTTILVERSEVHATRLKLMGKGVALRGGVGLEIFANNDFGMTDFAQRINYQRALQGELARTISALEEVRQVRVHLVLPESGLFRKSSVKPKAAITLSMKRGRAVSPQQVLGIQRLVAAAVPEIEAGSVTIVDDHGVTLSRLPDSEAGDGMDARMVAKGEFEQAVARKAVAVLDRAFGPGSAIVSVEVTLDHNQVRVTREEVLPGNARSGEGAMTRKRTSVTAQAAPAGPGEALRAPASTTELDFQNGRRVEQVVSRPGSVKQMSVGVLLPRALPPDRAEELRRLIAASVGLNPARGDELAITSIDQVRAAVAVAPAGMAASAADSALAGEPDGSEQPSTSREAGAAVATPLQPLWWLAAGALSLGALLALVMRRRRASTEALSPAAREDMLQQLRLWLAEDAAPSTEMRR
jgi:flagellar M-ring protein FliF